MSTEAADSPAPSVKAHEVRALLAVLKTNGGWMKCPELAVAIGHQKPAPERKVRKIASIAAPRVVSFPGSPGYCLLENCTEDEIEHCVNSLRAQGSDMIKRANLYARALNEQRMAVAPVEIQCALAL